MITHEFSLDMFPNGVPLVVHLSQYDDDFTLVFNLYSSEGTFALQSGTTAEIRGTKTDGKGFSASATINVSAKTVTVAGDQQMTAVAGWNVFELTLKNSNKELNTKNFIIDVEPAALDRDTIQSESKIMELYDVLDRADEIEQAAERIEEFAEQIPIDKSTGVKFSGYINNRVTPMVVKSDTKTKTAYFPCVPNVTYTINKMLSARFRVGYTAAVPANDVQIYGVIADNEATSISLTTGSNAQYIVVYYYDSANDTESESTIYNSLEVTYNTAVDKVARADIETLESNVSDLDDDLDGKVDKQQTLEDAGKVLVVGSDGVVYPEEIDTSGGLSDEAKMALLNCFAHVAWVDGHGQDYYDALELSLYPDQYPKIIAVFNSGLNVIYTADTLDSLKQYLTVTYYETEESEGTVISSANYTLSGTLVEGTSSIYALYDGLRTTFTINNVVDWYEIDERSISDGLMELQQGGIGTNNNEPKVIDYATRYPRYSVYVEKGKRGMWNNDNSALTDIYPIPVPSGATTVRVDITPNTQYFALQEFSYNATDNLYTKLVDNGWKTSGTTITLQSDADFVTINLKYDNAGTSYPVVPTDVAITFE